MASKQKHLFEAYQSSPSKVCLVVYDNTLANKVNRIFDAYPCLIQPFDEPKFEMSNHRFSILKSQVRELKKAAIEPSED